MCALNRGQLFRLTIYSLVVRTMSTIHVTGSNTGIFKDSSLLMQNPKPSCTLKGSSGLVVMFHVCISRGVSKEL